MAYCGPRPLLSGDVGNYTYSPGNSGRIFGRTYEETRDRPLYIVDEIVEADNVPCKLCEDLKRVRRLGVDERLPA